MTTVWMIWIQASDATWLEAAWDDEATLSNPKGWESEVERCRAMADNNRYLMRIQQVEVPGVFGLFKVPKVKATDVG